jgi:hypothetical protein
MAKSKKTNNDLQNITHKTKDRVTQTPLSLVLCVMFYFSGVCVTRCLVLCVMFYFSGVRVIRSLVLCVMFYFSGTRTPLK